MSISLVTRRIGPNKGRQVFTVTDEAGNPLFTSDSLEDAARVYRFIMGVPMTDEETTKTVKAMKGAANA